MTTFDATTVEALGWALVHFAWQGALAAGVFGALTLALHGAGARVRYALAGLRSALEADDRTPMEAEPRRRVGKGRG